MRNLRGSKAAAGPAGKARVPTPDRKNDPDRQGRAGRKVVSLSFACVLPSRRRRSAVRSAKALPACTSSGSFTRPASTAKRR